MIVVKTTLDPERVAKRIMYLAWKHSAVLGMGHFQDRGDQDEDAFWKSMYNCDDYPGAKRIPGFSPNRPGKVYADYVAGRMMKFGVEWQEGQVSGPDGPWRADYQSFCHQFPDFKSLAEAAIKSLESE